MDIITKSHIDQAHADSQYFPFAESADGKYRWVSDAHGYVEIVDYGSVYLQHPPVDIDPVMLAEARKFAIACLDLKEARRRSEDCAEIERISAPQTSDPYQGQLCKNCGTVCYGDCHA